LPPSLNEEVVAHQFGDFIELFKFFRNIESIEFVWAIVQKTKKLKWNKDELIYKQGDIAESLYLILKGTIKMKSSSGQTFMKYSEGDTIGESDALLNETRDCKAVPSEQCILYIIQTDQCQEIFAAYPEEFNKLKHNAYNKRQLHAKKLSKLKNKVPILLSLVDNVTS
jgi:signal-transduction protein with cAMP-binding, CBS, and nucleotidyltransferase domain